jgi:hypothetical protein
MVTLALIGMCGGLALAVLLSDQTPLGLDGIAQPKTDAGETVAFMGSFATAAPEAFWTDQRNSTILYISDGSLDSNMQMQTHANLDLCGELDPPWGVGFTFLGETIESPMQVIAGTVSLQGSPSPSMVRPARLVIQEDRFPDRVIRSYGNRYPSAPHLGPTVRCGPGPLFWYLFGFRTTNRGSETSETY